MLKEGKINISLNTYEKIGGNLMSAQNAQGPQIPILLLKEGTKETKGRDAQGNNIAAAKQVANIVKGSLGPRGMDKMLVSSIGDVTITNDGATILKEMDVEHPAAKMMDQSREILDQFNKSAKDDYD